MPNACAVAHARVGLKLVLDALAPPHDAEAVMTPVTIPDIANVVAGSGFRPVWADLEPASCNATVDTIAPCITPRTRLILITHLCGFPSTMGPIVKLAAERGIDVIEDCSQAIGATHRGQPIGTFGRAAVFSLSTLKPLTTLAGGVVVARDDELADRVRSAASRLPRPRPWTLLAYLARELALHAATDQWVFPRFTFPSLQLVRALIRTKLAPSDLVSSFVPTRFRLVARRDRLPPHMMVRMSDLQAEIGLRGLEDFCEETRRRQALAEYLHHLLLEKGAGRLVCGAFDPEAIYWRFPVRVRDRAACRSVLLSHGVDTAPPGLACLSRERAFGEFAAFTPHAFDFMDRSISLPLHPSMSQEDIERIAHGVATCVELGLG